ncbi:MAG: hypothetical protein ACQERD_05795 [Campylobacterota bacterium]
MILNTTKIKTEALLLFCKDLINSYKNQLHDLDSSNSELLNEFNSISEDMLIQINQVTFSTSYYLSNRKNFRIKAVLTAYNFINKELSSLLKKNSEFNPSMLYFAFLALWFKELNKESKTKAYIYFSLYPYSKAYDDFIVKNSDENSKFMNIKMIELAEKVIYKYDKISIV